jgi:hypothetical protein
MHAFVSFSATSGSRALPKARPETLVKSHALNPYTLNPYALNPYTLNPYTLDPYTLNPYCFILVAS